MKHCLWIHPIDIIINSDRRQARNMNTKNMANCINDPFNVLNLYSRSTCYFSDSFQCINQTVSIQKRENHSFEGRFVNRLPLCSRCIRCYVSVGIFLTVKPTAFHFLMVERENGNENYMDVLSLGQMGLDVQQSPFDV